ncbi:MAG TPA: CHAT domain-containing tetratricopeptide repeat protein [Acidobacteriaceae bacterium]|jgi:CHAT domain-containing protein|nr:CHAT domain-containing tetratricopeptide repeat protein [Acidobacteriaceae bacterium]
MILRSTRSAGIASYIRAYSILPAAAVLFALAAPAQTVTCAPVPDRHHQGLQPETRGSIVDAPILLELRQSYRLLSSSRPDALKDARSTLLHALASSTSANNRCGEALAAYALGDIADRIDFAHANAWFEQAASAFAAVPSLLGVAESHFRLAAVHSVQNHEQQSRQEFAAAAQELERAGDPVTAISARLYAQEESPDYIQQMGALQKRAQDLDALCEEADILRVWGDRAHQDAQYQAAMNHYQAADTLFTKCPGDASQRAALQTSMGRLERQQGRPAAALPHYQLALKLQRQSGDPSYIPQTYNAMAVAYEAMGDVTHAIALYKRGLEEARHLHSQPFIDFLSANLGSTYANNGRPLLGIPLLEGATRHLNSDYLICIRHDQLGNAYRDTGHLREAASHLDVAVAACEREAAKDALADALADRALTEMKSDQMDAAWTDAKRALAIVEEFRAHLVQADAYKSGYITAKQTRSTYDLAITILMRMKRYGQALEVAEQGRARALLDLLASAPKSADLRKVAGASEGLIASPEHTDALTVPQMLDEAARLHSIILAYWLTDSALYTWVAQPGQPVLGVTQTAKPTTIERLIRATLPIDSGSIETPTAIKGQSARSTQQPGQLQNIATRGRLGNNRASSSEPWRRLYSLLIAPVASDLPRQDGALLTIVPSGPLFRVSFAALIDGHNHYLVEHYRMHTIPMVGLLKYTHRNEVEAASRPVRYLFVAAPNHLPAGPDGLPLPSLPGAAAEVHTVAALLPPPQVTVLTGEDALRLRVELDAPEATYIHFATHAIVSNEHPERTYLALDDVQGAGRLTLDDIYALHLRARLIVLSACSTGLGKISGDGVAGLSRAFFYAGSASVLTTLWDVADRPTAVMLPRFYMALRHDETPSEALRTAQLAMLNDLRHGRLRIETLRGSVTLPPSPIYWAGFSLSGEP